MECLKREEEYCEMDNNDQYMYTCDCLDGGATSDDTSDLMNNIFTDSNNSARTMSVNEK